MDTLHNILKEIWLEEKEVDVYLSSLKIGTCASSSISNMLYLPKSTVRYTLDSLVKKQLMTKVQKWNTTLFSPEHPQKIKNLLIIEKNKLENKESKLDNIMWDLIWYYNPYTKVPKVTFYEWIEWIQRVLNDSLTSTEIIDWFVNVDDVIKNISWMNKKYTEKRIEKQVHKRSIYSSSDKTKKYLDSIYNKNSLNDIRYLDSTDYNLYISFMMYDWKISYITFKDNEFVWVIIQNQDIYNFHKSIFKFMWNHL